MKKKTVTVSVQLTVSVESNGDFSEEVFENLKVSASGKNVEMLDYSIYAVKESY